MYKLSDVPKIIDLLLSKNLITKTDYDDLVKSHVKTGISLEVLIEQRNLVPAEELTKARGEILGVKYIDLTGIEVDHEILQKIPADIAKQHLLFPFALKDDVLSLAMADPLDLQLIEYIEKKSQTSVEPFIATISSLNTSIEREYSKSMGEEVSKAIQDAETEVTERTMKENLKSTENAEEVIKTSPVAQIVSVLLEYAVKSGASDIHIEPFEDGTRIRYRIDGVLQEKFPLPQQVHDSLVARIKILAHMKIDEHRMPLDGKFKIIFGKSKTDLRVSTLPTMYGEKVVIRLLKDQQETFTFKDLGLWGKSLQVFEHNLAQTTGIILITGPTGSGKTVTNATALSKLNKVGVNIITLEDPIEINIKGVNQVQINPKAGLTFASGLRSILRQDPNIIMVGEIRDSETAQLAIQAALTGHLVLATVHTNSAPGVVPRLVDMGVEKFLLASTLNVSLAQRLARKICPYCKEEYTPSKEIEDKIKEILGEDKFNLGLGPSPFRDNDGSVKQEPHTKGSIKLYRGTGCAKCNNLGYKGRIGLYEVMDITPDIQKATLNGEATSVIKKIAIENGMITLIQDGYLKSMWGETTIEEVLSVVGDQT